MRSIAGHGRFRTRKPSSPSPTGLPCLVENVGLAAEEGPRARAGLEGTQGMGVIMNMPVSVCHQVSMIGQRSLPMFV